MPIGNLTTSLTLRLRGRIRRRGFADRRSHGSPRVYRGPLTVALAVLAAPAGVIAEATLSRSLSALSSSLSSPGRP